MCTIVILNRPDHAWPILIAATRDERLDRPWLFSAAHWAGPPDIMAGQDELAGGSWLGMNATGVVAAVLNREGTLGPEAGKRSRGELVLDALDYADALDAAEAPSALDSRGALRARLSSVQPGGRRQSRRPAADPSRRQHGGRGRTAAGGPVDGDGA